MQPSMFNLRVPLPERGEVFLMNTMSDAQLVVSADVAGLLDNLPSPDEVGRLGADERAALTTLIDHGFVVARPDADRERLERFFRMTREDTSEMRVTLLTTLQCNFACGYCFQGDHGDYNKYAHKMSLETAARVGDWVEARLDELEPEKLALTFFGGEPLLNLPVMYYLSERLHAAGERRDLWMLINVITNGLLLTPEVVDRLEPLGLNGVKITLDGDRATHDRMRPLRGGQGTFDRILANIRRVAGRCRISIGGNFDASSVQSYPALLDFLKEQEFADQIARINFKPVITPAAPGKTAVIPLTALKRDGTPLQSTCMTSAGAGSSPCDTCHFVDEQMEFLRRETRRRGLPTLDGVHMGPCEIHRRHAYTIGPDGALYACPGFTGDAGMSTGHIDGRTDPRQERTARRFDALAPWRKCGDCSFIPVCGGGCSFASHTELGDMDTPACHKSSMESALVSLAHDVAGAT